MTLEYACARLRGMLAGPDRAFVVREEVLHG